VQPVFNRDVIAALSDSAASSLLELEAWINGEDFIDTLDTIHEMQASVKGSETQANLTNLESDLYTALSQNDISAAAAIVSQLSSYIEEERRTIFTTVFLRTIADGSLPSLKFLLDTKLVDTTRNDEITDRGCLHESAIAGRLDVVVLCVEHGSIPL
jgi:CDK inhibitor PHO81